MENYKNDLNSIEEDQEIYNYMFLNNICLYEFVKKYIKFDILLKESAFKNENNTDVVSSVLNELKNLRLNTKEQLEKMEWNTKNNIKEQLEISLQKITNTDIKNIINDCINIKDTNLSNMFINFQEKISNINDKNLNEFDTKTLNLLTNMQNTFKNSLDTHTISDKINTIESTLTVLNNNFTSNSAKKGQMAENILYNNLLKVFPDSDIQIVSSLKNSGDIYIKKENRPDILIDSKQFDSQNVPKIDLEKFHKDCTLNNCSGILANSFSGIANKEHFQIDIVDTRAYVYISNHQFDNSLFKLAVKIIYNIYDVIKHNKTGIVEIDKILFQRLKVEYNYFIQTYKQHLNVIKQNVNSLEQLGMSQLDMFFKRTHSFNHKIKPFSCPDCGIGFSSEKATKKHLKDKHNIVIKRGEDTESVQPPDEDFSPNKNNGYDINEYEYDIDTECMEDDVSDEVQPEQKKEDALPTQRLDIGEGIEEPQRVTNKRVSNRKNRYN